MDGTASTPHVRRRSIAWILWSAVGGCALALVAVVLWLELPRWAPDLVIRHSPFVDPVLRAMGAKLRTGPFPAAANHKIFDDRVSGWGMGMVPGVMAALESSDASCRMAALLAWLRLTDQDENRPPSLLVDALCWHALNESDGNSRALAIIGLIKVIDPRVKQVVLAGLRDPHVLVREVAVQVCKEKQLKDEEILTALVKILRDPAPTVRQASARVFELSKEIRAVDALIAALAVESVPDIADGQIRALGWIGDRRATEPLLQIVRRPAASTQQARLVVQALESLQMIDRATAMPLWIAGLAHEHAFVRWSAVRRLGDINDPSITAELLERVVDANAYVLTQAVWVLAAREDPGVIEKLLDAYEQGCCTPGSTDWEKDKSGLETDDYELPPLKSVWSILDRLPFTDAQRKRWEAMRDK